VLCHSELPSSVARVSRAAAGTEAEHLKAQAEKSLRLLGLEHIELFQLHRIDPEVPLTDQLGALIELQAEGKIEFT
jgi:aryl-alcohol dehydrogenase-like predicted oxidoreductase